MPTWSVRERRIGPFDILIAAQARRRDALLVTANEREFKTSAWIENRELGGVTCQPT